MQLILLVGGNPLPNYVAARALTAKHGIDVVHLLYTPQVEQVKDNLAECLKDSGLTCGYTLIRDAGSAGAIRRACSRIDGGTSYFHYTGGTNAMAVHAHAAWMSAGGCRSRASYLFGATGRLMVDDGNVMAIPCSVKLDVATLAKLHGLSHATPRTSSPGDPKPSDAEGLATYVCKDFHGAQRIYDRLSKHRKLKADPFRPSDEGLSLSEPLIGQDESTKSPWSNRRIEHWLKFLRGEWLEEWVASKISGTKLADQVHTGIRPHITIAGGASREFELDVVAIRGHHLYVASCTTEHRLRRCKDKLFEVSMRARQLGGDLARSALICLAESADVDQLQKDVQSLTESSRVTQVFGLDDFRSWVGCGRSPSTLDSLTEWLKT